MEFSACMRCNDLVYNISQRRPVYTCNCGDVACSSERSATHEFSEIFNSDRECEQMLVTCSFKEQHIYSP